MQVSARSSPSIEAPSGDMIGAHIQGLDLQKSLRLINHGPTVLVSAACGGETDVMAAAWVCPLDFAPPKLTVVLDAATRTRALIERSGEFVVQVPTVSQITLVHAVGTESLGQQPEKLAQAGVDMFHMDGVAPPLVSGCSGWLACKVISEARNQEIYDLFIAEITGAWADARIFRDGHWHFEASDPRWRSLHYVAGGHFYAIGEALDASMSHHART